MDISSINDGTVDTKGWLNPTVGTLRAKKIICDDIEGGGGGSASALNSAVNPGTFPEAINTGSFIGGAAGYNPVSRLFPTSDIYAANSSFKFECSGTLESDVTGTDNTSRPIFGIMVGDDFNQDTSTGLLGYTVLGLDGSVFSQTLVWTYKLVATHVASATQGGLAFTWTSELTFGKNNTAFGGSSAGVVRRIAMGKKDLGVVTPVGDGVRFSMYIGNMDWGGSDTMTIVKYNHTFQRVA
jgi:hypothetical protein